MRKFLNDFKYKLDIHDGDTDEVLATDVACSLEDLIGKRLEMAQALAANTTHKFVVRANSLIDSTRNLVSNSQTYQVTYVLDPGVPFRGVYMEVFAMRVKDGI
jgi:hypothetical protein